MIVIERQGPKFSGDLGKDRLKFEKAQENIETLVEKATPIQEAMFERTGFHRFNLPPPGITPTYIPKDENVEVQAVVNTQGKIKTPSYKEVCKAFTNYLDGIVFQLALGQRITGVRREKNISYIRIDIVKKAYDISVGGHLEPSYRHKSIDLILRGPIAKEKAFTHLDIEEIDRTSLTQDYLIFYVRAWRIINADQRLVNAYKKSLEEKLPKDEKEKTVQVTSKSAYGLGKETRVKPDYTLAAKTIITVPVKTKPRYAGQIIPEVGELNQLADSELSLIEKKEMFPYYDLIERKKSLYISIPTLYERIQSMIGKEPTVYDVIHIKPKEIIR